MLTIKDAVLAIRRAADREKDYQIVRWCNFALSDVEVIGEHMSGIVLLSKSHVLTNSEDLAHAIEKAGRATLIDIKDIDHVHR